jgi:predicted outer membrane protein
LVTSDTDDQDLNHADKRFQYAALAMVCQKARGVNPRSAGWAGRSAILDMEIISRSRMMKKMLLLPMTILLASCGGGGGDTASTSLLSNGTVIATQPGTPGATTTPMQATPNGQTAVAGMQEFLTDAYQENQTEIVLANLAAQKSLRPEVKRYAASLAADHTAANMRLAQLAQAMSVTLPGSVGGTQGNENESSSVQSQLAALSGTAFDQAYLAYNYQTHQQDVLQHFMQSEQAENNQLRLFAENALPLLQTHLAMTEELLASIDATAYLQIAYQHGLTEISLSRLALEKATLESVKPFAQMLIDHHTMLNEELARVAQARGLTLPAEPTAVNQALQKHFTLLQGMDFDKAYMSRNLVIHAGDVSATAAQAETAADADIKSLATAALPRLTEHLRLSTDLYLSIAPSFLAAAHQSNVGELLLAHRALEKSSDANVRRFAQHMVEDHTRADDELKTLARQEDVILPKALPAEFFLMHRALARLDQAAFDLAYMTADVEAHTKAVSMFVHYAANHPDPEQRAYAAATLPTLRGHLQEATQIRASLPPASGGSAGENGSTGNTEAGQNIGAETEAGAIPGAAAGQVSG